jgi:OMF family outer membrane factor
MRIFLRVLLFWAFPFWLQAQSPLRIRQLDSLLHQIESRSNVSEIGKMQSALARSTTRAARLNTLNFRSPIQAQYTDNTQLPVSYLPAEAFGGQPGNFREVQIGQQFVSTWSISPQVDLLNPAAWARVESARQNERRVEESRKKELRQVLESATAAWFNWVSAQRSLRQLTQSLQTADSLQALMERKFREGMVRKQDLNLARLNPMSLRDKIRQSEMQQAQALATLKSLLELEAETDLQLDPMEKESQAETQTVMAGQQNTRTALAQEAYDQAEWKAGRWQSFAPTLSLLFNQSWQQNSNQRFFDRNGQNFNAQYVALKLSIPFPLDPNRMSLDFNNKIQWKIARQRRQHARFTDQLEQQILRLEQEKSLSGLQVQEQTFRLREENYRLALAQFEEGFIAADQLLNAFSERINARTQYDNARSQHEYQLARISIHNRFL